MPTTSLKLPDDLKERAAAAARQQGVSTHAFMVEAIRAAAASAEDRARFVAEAREAHASMLESGQGFDADDVHAWLRERAAGRAAQRPQAKPWRR